MGKGLPEIVLIPYYYFQIRKICSEAFYAPPTPPKEDNNTGVGLNKHLNTFKTSKPDKLLTVLWYGHLKRLLSGISGSTHNVNT